MIRVTLSPWIRAAALLALAAGTRAYANRPPTVNAGDDQDDVGTQSVSYLFGAVEDDSTPTDKLITKWTQLRGPALATIDDPANATTMVTFPDSGTYAFELRASDGSLSAADTVVWHVHRSLPFLVLAPASGAQVPAGKAYTLRWQMDPSVPCSVYYSVDGGKHWTLINTDGSKRDSLAWAVPADLAPGTQALLKVQEYQGPKTATTPFIFSATAGVAGGSGRAGAFSITMETSGELRVTGAAPRRGLILSDALGKRAGPGVSARRALWYSVRGADGHGLAGRVEAAP